MVAKKEIVKKTKNEAEFVKAMHAAVMRIAKKHKNWKSGKEIRIRGYVVVTRSALRMRSCECRYCWDDENTQTCRCVSCKCA